MDEIRYTLITDGSSDRALIPILTWVLREKGKVDRIQPEDISELKQNGWSGAFGLQTN